MKYSTNRLYRDSLLIETEIIETKKIIKKKTLKEKLSGKGFLKKLLGKINLGSK
jgi:hypothetical protein